MDEERDYTIVLHEEMIQKVHSIDAAHKIILCESSVIEKDEEFFV